MRKPFPLIGTGHIRHVAVLSCFLVLTGCAQGDGPDADDPSSEWRGTITTEGSVTTVINESGSVWGGTARLVEEASIGVEVGDDVYMFGNVAAVLAHENEIFVADRQVATIRVYDLDGNHLRDIGREGQGPGEFSSGGARTPTGMAIGPEGALHVKTPTTIEVFSTDGEYLDTWRMARPRGFGHSGFQIAAPEAGSAVLAEDIRCPEPRPWPCGGRLLVVHEDGQVEETGTVPDLGYAVPRIEIQFDHGYGPEWTGGVPAFVPEVVWTVDPEGRLVVGRADRYEIERHGRDGSRLVISRYWDPVPVQAEEGAWHLRYERSRGGSVDVTSVTGYDLDQGLPDHKPAFADFIPGHDGGLWVVRAGPGERLSGCDEDATDREAMREGRCWRDTAIIDAFGPDGRYLGEVEVPEIFSDAVLPTLMFMPEPFVRDDMVLAVAEDDAGTIKVKRYGLVLPGEDTQ